MLIKSALQLQLPVDGFAVIADASAYLIDYKFQIAVRLTLEQTAAQAEFFSSRLLRSAQEAT